MAEEVDNAAEKLEALQLDLKVLPDDQIQRLFDKLKALPVADEVILASPEGNKLFATNQPTDAELQSLNKLFSDHDYAFSNAINISGIRHEVHKYFPEQGTIYGRFGKGNKESQGIVVVKNFSNVLAAVVFKYPTLTARAVPAVKKVIAEF